jgi:lipid II:glycine glycyltransferase (peptidoglycan interpeptide bridge formation enzyme)
MQLQYINPLLQKQWEDLIKENPASGYMQSFWWAQFQNLLGWETYKIGIFEKEKLLGGAVIAKYSHYKNKSILYIPEGPVLPYDRPEAQEMFDVLSKDILHFPQILIRT